MKKTAATAKRMPKRLAKKTVGGKRSTARRPQRSRARPRSRAEARAEAPLYAVCGDFDLLLECRSCSEPDGHVYLLVHGEFRCVHCGLGELA